MSETTDAMLSGLLCQVCGVLIDDSEPGYPRVCAGCEADEAEIRKDEIDRDKRRM